MSKSENGVDAWDRRSLGALTEPQNLRVGDAHPVVMSCTKYHGLVPSDDYFKGRTVYSSDISNYKLVKKDWFAYATNHLAEGSIGIQDQFDEACVSPIYTVFSCAGNVDPEFLFRLLKTEALVNQYKVHEQATVDRRGAIRYLDFAKIEVELPTFPEQRRVADILHTVDEAIRCTEQLIAKLQQMKQGMLNDLLTRGLDENGILRDRDLHPEQFEVSALGPLPRDWTVERLGAVATKIQDGTHFSPQTSDGPFMYVTSKNVRFGYLDLSDCGWISESEHRRIFDRCDVRAGDVLLTKDGANTGNAALNTVAEPFSLLSSVALVRLDAKRDVPRFLLQYLLSPVGQRRIKDAVAGLAITRLTLRTINQLFVPRPPRDEQLRIAELLTPFDDRLQQELLYLSKLQNVKDGLAHDLLTGRVRVNGILDGDAA